MSTAWHIALGAGELVLRMLVIIVPLMVLMKGLQEYRVIEWFGRYANRLIRPAGLSQEAVFPLLIGLLLGVTYGAGALLEVARKGLLARSEVKTVGLFLGLCHSLIEDTALMVMLGASVFWLVVVRLVVSVVMATVTRPLLGKDGASL